MLCRSYTNGINEIIIENIPYIEYKIYSLNDNPHFNELELDI